MDRVARRLAEVPPGSEIGDPDAVRLWRRVERGEGMDKTATNGRPARWLGCGRSRLSPRCPSWETGTGHGCLDRCLRCLPPQDKDIILTYYQDEGLAKIRHRSMVARQLKISSNALRLRIHRITLRLRECVFHCVDTAKPGHVGLH